MAQDWLSSAVNITEDILAMAKGFDDSNRAAVPSTSSGTIVPATKVVPDGMTSTPTTLASPNNTLLLVGAGLVALFLLLR